MMAVLLFAGAGGPVVLNPTLFTSAAARGLDEDGFGVRSFSGSDLPSGKDSRG